MEYRCRFDKIKINMIFFPIRTCVALDSSDHMTRNSTPPWQHGLNDGCYFERVSLRYALCSSLKFHPIILIRIKRGIFQKNITEAQKQNL